MHVLIFVNEIQSCENFLKFACDYSETIIVNSVKVLIGQQLVANALN